MDLMIFYNNVYKKNIFKQYIIGDKNERTIMGFV